MWQSELPEKDDLTDPSLSSTYSIFTTMRRKPQEGIDELFAESILNLAVR